MAELKRVFEAAGYENVRTYIASGNVVFESDTSDADRLAREVEAKLEAALAYDIDVILCSAEEMKRIVASDPFAGVTLGAETKLNVTFLAKEPDSGRVAPGEPAPGFRIIAVSDRAVFSVLDTGVGTRDAMTVLEKMLGKGITTRTWNVAQAVEAMCQTDDD
jgi:uncharacterized protein (DUF1697 family)